MADNPPAVSPTFPAEPITPQAATMTDTINTVVSSSFTLALDEGIGAETLAEDATFRDNLARAV